MTFLSVFLFLTFLRSHNGQQLRNRAYPRVLCSKWEALSQHVNTDVCDALCIGGDSLTRLRAEGTKLFIVQTDHERMQYSAGLSIVNNSTIAEASFNHSDNETSPSASSIAAEASSDATVEVTVLNGGSAAAAAESESSSIIAVDVGNSSELGNLRALEGGHHEQYYVKHIVPIPQAPPQPATPPPVAPGVTPTVPPAQPYSAPGAAAAAAAAASHGSAAAAAAAVGGAAAAAAAAAVAPPTAQTAAPVVPPVAPAVPATQAPAAPSHKAIYVPVHIPVSKKNKHITEKTIVQPQMCSSSENSSECEVSNGKTSSTTTTTTTLSSSSFE